MDKVNEYFNNIDLPLNTLMEYAKIIFSLILALFIAKIIASIIGKVIKKANFLKTTFEKIGINLDMNKVGNIVSKIVYFLLIFAIFIGFLSFFNIDSKNLPLIGNLQQFINNGINAGLLALVTWFLAYIAKFSIVKSFKSTDLEKTLSENFKTEGNISKNIGTIVYWVIILFFLPKILKLLDLGEISDQIDGIIKSITSYIPDLFGAGLIIVIFYFVGKIISKLVSDFLVGVGFDKILNMIGIENVNSPTKPSTIMGSIVFVYIMLFAIIEASTTLGFSNITNIVNQIMGFTTNILIGVIILAIGMYLGNLASNAIKSATSSKVLPAVAKIGIIILTTFMALQQMQIGGAIVNQAFTLLLGSIAVAFALAVGLGSKEVAGEEVKRLIEKLKK